MFHSAFYQLFDGGEFEDKNYSVELGPSLIICTSNYRSDRDVREALGEALYSRFDAVIGFENLSETEVLQVIDRLLLGRFAHLSERERQHLDRAGVFEQLRPLASQSNVRSLGKTIDEVLSISLVGALLDHENASEAPGGDNEG